jgi:hypothetical protein
MKLKHFLGALALLACCSYSYSEVVRGQTANATAGGLTWTMTNILPKYTGLSVTAVSYQYTAQKQTQDPFVVNVQNLSSTGNGYVFRTQDDWTGVPGNTITKTVPVNNILGTQWGPGEITTQGVGQVVDYSLFYNYTYDTCKSAVVVDPGCPNYKSSAIFAYSEDEFVVGSYQVKKYMPDAIEEENSRKFVLASSNAKARSRSTNTAKNALLTAQALGLAQSFEALNNLPGLVAYSQQIPGGVYKDVLQYADKKLPDSSNSRRLNLSQERLHNQLVDLQYMIKK